jgi:NAD-dependent deacetylase
MNGYESNVRTACEHLRNAPHVFVLTGAGISAESGVPTFREGGVATVWRGMPFDKISSAEMVEKNLPLVWEWFDYRRRRVSECEPNAGHTAIVHATRSGRYEAFTLVTQNIDGLHAAAGFSDVIELHGNIHRAKCLSCGFLQDLGSIADDERPPLCPKCLDSMRPDVVLFGEMLSPDAVDSARAAAANCDVCIVVGTTAVVYPANTLPQIAKAAGAYLIEINPEATVLSSSCDTSIRGTAAEILPLLFPNTGEDMAALPEYQGADILHPMMVANSAKTAEKEEVLSLGFEGGGAEIYRLRGKDGKWYFINSGTSMTLDDDDDEEWISWEHAPTTSIVEALDDLGLGVDILCIHPLFVHPDYRSDVNRYIDMTIQSVTDDERQRFGDFIVKDADSWLAKADRHMNLELQKKSN